MTTLAQCLCDNREASYRRQIWVLQVDGRYLGVTAVTKRQRSAFIGRLVAGQWFPKEA